MKAVLLHRISYPLLASVIFAASGCSHESKMTPLSSMFYAETPEMFANAVPISNRGYAQISTGSKFDFYFDNDQRTVEITARNLDLGNGSSDYVFKGVDWDFAIGTPTVQRVIRQSVIVSVDAMGGHQELTDVTMIYYEPNELDNMDCRGVYIDFTANGKHFTLYPLHLYCKGTTLAQTLNGDDHSILYSPALSIDFHPALGQADIIIDNFSTDSENSAVNVVVDAATAVFQPGIYTITAQKAAVNDSVSIVDFNAVGQMDRELNVTYTVVTPGKEVKVSSQLLPNFYDTPTLQSAI